MHNNNGNVIMHSACYCILRRVGKNHFFRNIQSRAKRRYFVFLPIIRFWWKHDFCSFLSIRGSTLYSAVNFFSVLGILTLTVSNVNWLGPARPWTQHFQVSCLSADLKCYLFFEHPCSFIVFVCEIRTWKYNEQSQNYSYKHKKVTDFTINSKGFNVFIDSEFIEINYIRATNNKGNGSNEIVIIISLLILYAGYMVGEKRNIGVTDGLILRFFFSLHWVTIVYFSPNKSDHYKVQNRKKIRDTLLFIWVLILFVVVVYI